MMALFVVDVFYPNGSILQWWLLCNNVWWRDDIMMTDDDDDDDTITGKPVDIQ